MPPHNTLCVSGGYSPDDDSEIPVADFHRSKLFAPLLSLQYAPLIEQLKHFAKQRLALKDAPKETRRAKLGPLHDAIVAESIRLLPPDDDDIAKRRAELGFALGALLCPWFKASAVGCQVVDTYGSETLAAYRADFVDGEHNAQRLRTAIINAFSLSETELAELDFRVNHERSQLEVRERLIAALDQHYGFHEKDDADLQNAVFALLTDFYGETGLVPEDVSLVRTGLSLFFFVEAHEAGLAFMERALSWKHSQFRHFPVFGAFVGEDVDADLRERWSETSGLSVKEITRVLAEMVSIFKRHEVEKYLVHDIWGHQWQSVLLPFEEDFAAMSKSLRLPGLDISFEGLNGQLFSLGKTMQSAICTLTEGQPLPVEHFDGWIYAVAAERIRRSVTGMTAELLADICEYKFKIESPEIAHLMPSSSAFDDLPTKLDLSFMDLEFFFPVGLRAFQRLDSGTKAIEWLTGRVQSAFEDAPADVVSAAVRALEARVASLNEGMLAVEFQATETADGLQANLYTRMALNMAGLHATLLTVYERLHAQNREYPAPLGGFRDLFALAAGAYYQMDPAHHFWHLDEFIGLHFEDCLDRLVTELNRA